jgi:uncharacterized phage-associated protein
VLVNGSVVRFRAGTIKDVPRSQVVSAHDVAAVLQERLPGLGATKLHKLLYYCQGWHLALNGVRLYEESVEAWEQGPVVKRLWADQKHDRPPPPRRALPSDAEFVVEYVITRYGHLSGRDLSVLSHAENPWHQAWSDGNVTSEITIASLEEWFTSDDEFVKRCESVEEHRSSAAAFGLSASVPASMVEAALAARR